MAAENAVLELQVICVIVCFCCFYLFTLNIVIIYFNLSLCFARFYWGTMNHHHHHHHYHPHHHLRRRRGIVVLRRRAKPLFLHPLDSRPLPVDQGRLRRHRPATAYLINHPTWTLPLPMKPQLQQHHHPSTSTTMTQPSTRIRQLMTAVL